MMKIPSCLLQKVTYRYSQEGVALGSSRSKPLFINN